MNEPDTVEHHQIMMAEAQREAAFLNKAALAPNLPPDRRVVYRNLARSAGAEVTLRQAAIEHLNSQGQAGPQNPADQTPPLSQTTGD